MTDTRPMTGEEAYTFYCEQFEGPDRAGVDGGLALASPRFRDAWNALAAAMMRVATLAADADAVTGYKEQQAAFAEILEAERAKVALFQHALEWISELSGSDAGDKAILAAKNVLLETEDKS